MDTNTEFAYADVAGDFSNSSAGFSPTIFAFPSCPDPVTSANVFGTVLRHTGLGLTLGYGLYDGAAAAGGVRTETHGPASSSDGDLSSDYFHIAQVEVPRDGAFPGSTLLGEGRVSLGA